MSPLFPRDVCGRLGGWMLRLRAQEEPATAQQPRHRAGLPQSRPTPMDLLVRDIERRLAPGRMRDQFPDADRVTALDTVRAS